MIRMVNFILCVVYTPQKIKNKTKTTTKFQKTLGYTAKAKQKSIVEFPLKTMDKKRISSVLRDSSPTVPVHLYNMPVIVPAATVLRSSSAPRVFSMMTPNAL